MKRSAILFIMCLSTIGELSAEDVADSKKAAITTNLAYLTLSAVSTNSNNIFLIVPLEAQIMVGNRISVNPSLTFLYFGNPQNNYDGALILGECGVGYHSEKENLYGWSAGISPGLAYAFDAKLFGFVLSAEAGYQWALGNGLLLGVSGGGKYIWMDGDMVIPDLKLRIGYTF
jgi:hypothetical protein